MELKGWKQLGNHQPTNGLEKCHTATGNCEEELPKKPVGRQTADSRPTGGRQVLPEI